MQSLVFEVGVTDPSVFAIVVVGLLATAATAAHMPARRATRLDLVKAFRDI